jgi:hypothetical protein
MGSLSEMVDKMTTNIFDVLLFALTEGTLGGAVLLLAPEKAGLVPVGRARRLAPGG